MKNRVSAWIILTIITVAAALGLALTNQITMEPISQQAIVAEEKARKLVMPGAETFEKLELDDGSVLFVAKAGDEVIGYIGKDAAKGYSGEIEVITGVSAMASSPGSTSAVPISLKPRAWAPRPRIQPLPRSLPEKIVLCKGVIQKMTTQ